MAVSAPGARTRLVGLIGWPVAHSLSPAMHNAAAAALGLELAYVALPVRPGDLAAAVGGLAALGFVGANVTIPHKEAVIPLLDEVDAAARAIGAVNVVGIGDRGLGAGGWGLGAGEWGAGEQGSGGEEAGGRARIVGYNTDWVGFWEDLAAMGVEVDGREALVLGAGGAARAVAYALVQRGARVRVAARRPEQARRLAADLAATGGRGALTGHSLDALAALVEVGPALIVNAIPGEMSGAADGSPWPDGVPFPAGAFLYDLAYRPAETAIMRQARAAGGEAANGLGMLVRQGAAAFRLWTGLEPDLEVMRAAAVRVS